MESLCKKMICSILILLFAVLITGCGDGSALTTAEGTVTLDGKPVADAGVLFTPVKGGQPATGTTDATGHFKVRMANQDGVMAGEYLVTITKNETQGVDLLNPKATPVRQRVIWHIPEKYSNATTSGLTATVPCDNGEFKFDLTSKFIRGYQN